MNNFKKYKKGTITMEIQAFMPEKFINLLWTNGIIVKNIKKINITTLVLEVKLCDYVEIAKVAQKSNSTIRIVSRSGLSFFVMKMKRRSALLIGAFLFLSIIYYLSTFVWNIKINTEHYISPYELRNQISGFGINPGLRKKNMDVYEIENKILRNNDEIMWVKARIDGVKLKIDVIERQSPPIIISKQQPPRDLIANKDGEVVRVFTTEGTAVVKNGDMIQKGDLLVKGEQGKEGSVYPVHAQGEVIAKTFYEEIKEVPLNNISRIKTGNSISNLYIKLANKKIYLKNSLITYAKYDKIESKDKFIKSEIYYEIEEKNIKVDVTKVTDEIYHSILRNLNKNVVIIDKIVDAKVDKSKYIIKVLIVAEENIAPE
ncbi:sporulation protein YqfD [Clostridium bowmanii]|uniref:sporulation protein YqfD n=1 Tax=Clostridium bowmanii TaxID=132925 RepID=UPI001C0B7B57|nr:sporulation protein YqfD [Clostridium bowmanii]MBU3189701.1 sporulation protein YqfD [Clostridium bowmanii]MCA1074183.1 sporulation protein YqfD [Clostridium bowmanii]